MLATRACKKTYISSVIENNPLFLLKHISYIYHLVWFKKDKAKIKALLNSNNEINAMTPVYAVKLGFKV